MASPWVTFQDPAGSEVETLEYSVFSECLQGILRAGRGEAARCRSKRGDAHLVETDQQDERKNQDFSDKFQCLICYRFHFQMLLQKDSDYCLIF